jgi:hypothetical protein
MQPTEERLTRIDQKPRPEFCVWSGNLTKVPVTLGLVVLAATSCLTRAFATEGPFKPQVKVVHAPEKCLVPDVLVDSKGVLHMVYGLEHHAYYVRSTDNGATFSAAARVDATGLVETKMGERGPKLALGKDGIVHAVWMDEWAPGVKTYVRYSRSTDGGKSFEPVKSLSSMSGIDGVTVAADGQGNVISFWHVMAEPKPEVKSATWLFMARSTDNGATFRPDEKLNLSNLSGLACSMCMMRARAGADGNVYLAFRSGVDSIRDFYVLKGRATENRFTAVRVNEDNWKIDFCPMCGPELTLAADGRSLCAFMSRNRVYWAVADSPGDAFRLHASTPANEENEIYPTAVANSRGDVLLVWQVGPMATKGTANVKWARYTGDGKPTGDTGEVGKSFAGTKATAFVGTDDNFYIITTAKRMKEP